MAEDDDGSRRAAHVTSVQAWGADLDGQRSVVVELGIDDGEVPPLVVPVDAVPGLVAVLLQAAGLEPVELRSAATTAARRDDEDDWPEPEVVAEDGSAWSRLVGAERTAAVDLARATLPTGPGAYVWFRRGVPVHLGRAVGKRGLRARIGGDALRGDADLSRSPFRAAVAAHVGIVEPDGGLPHLDPDEVARVDDWIAGCAVAWLRCGTPAQASHLEAALRADHDPSLPPGR